jgi:hypothetical protein
MQNPSNVDLIKVFDILKSIDLTRALDVLNVLQNEKKSTLECPEDIVNSYNFKATVVAESDIPVTKEELINHFNKLTLKLFKETGKFLTREFILDSIPNKIVEITNSKIKVVIPVVNRASTPKTTNTIPTIKTSTTKSASQSWLNNPEYVERFEDFFTTNYDHVDTPMTKFKDFLIDFTNETGITVVPAWNNRYEQLCQQLSIKIEKVVDPNFNYNNSGTYYAYIQRKNVQKYTKEEPEQLTLHLSAAPKHKTLTTPSNMAKFINNNLTIKTCSGENVSYLIKTGVIPDIPGVTAQIVNPVNFPINASNTVIPQLPFFPIEKNKTDSDVHLSQTSNCKTDSTRLSQIPFNTTQKVDETQNTAPVNENKTPVNENKTPVNENKTPVNENKTPITENRLPQNSQSSTKKRAATKTNKIKMPQSLQHLIENTDGLPDSTEQPSVNNFDIHIQQNLLSNAPSKVISNTNIPQIPLTDPSTMTSKMNDSRFFPTSTHQMHHIPSNISNIPAKLPLQSNIPQIPLLISNSPLNNIPQIPLSMDPLSTNSIAQNNLELHNLPVNMPVNSALRNNPQIPLLNDQSVTTLQTSSEQTQLSTSKPKISQNLSLNVDGKLQNGSQRISLLPVAQTIHNSTINSLNDSQMILPPTIKPQVAKTTMVLPDSLTSHGKYSTLTVPSLPLELSRSLEIPKLSIPNIDTANYATPGDVVSFS